MIRRTILRVAKKMLPGNSVARRMLKKTAMKLGLISPFYADIRYHEWVLSTEKMFWTSPRELSYKPLISIIVPVFNVPEVYLREAVFSVVNQTYPNWELLLINASTVQDSRDATEDCGNIDTRIKVITIEKNLGIAGNTNVGIEHARGDYVALLDNDDTLAPEALYEVVCELQGGEKPDFLYSDEDKLSADSEQRFDPHFKADWSPYMMRQVNYLNHLTVLNMQLVRKVGGYRAGFEGAQDYDLYLRLIDEGAVMRHVPKILYHWRAIMTSTAANFSSKSNVLTAGKKALSEHLLRNNLQGKVTSIDKQPGFYDIAYKANSSEIALVLLPSTDAHQYAEYSRKLMALVGKAGQVSVYVCNLKANKKLLSEYDGKLINICAESTEEYMTKAVRTSTAKTIVFFGAALLWAKSDTWLVKAAGFLEQCHDINAIVPLIINKSANTIVDAGSINIGVEQMPLFVGYPVGAHTFLGNSNWNRHLDGCSGRCVMMRREVAIKITKIGLTGTHAIAQSVASLKGEVILWPYARLSYAGDFQTGSVSGNGVMPVFSFSHQELSFGKGVYYIPSGADNA